MKLELPEKFKHPIAEVVDGQLMIFRLERFEDLNYELTYALKKKKCIYCDEKLRIKNRTLDHRYPRATGGISITNNLFPCCNKCNSKKSNLTHKEFVDFQEMKKEDRKQYVQLVTKYKEQILHRIGYVLPNKWVEYIDVENVKFRKIDYFFHGKKFCRISEFYSKYKHLPRPIIVDKENNLLDGYNAFIFATEFGIKQIPVIRLENVILVVSKDGYVE